MATTLAVAIQSEIARLERQMGDYKRAVKSCASDHQKSAQIERNMRDAQARIAELRANLKLVARE